jgi:hypothetical protein
VGAQVEGLGIRSVGRRRAHQRGEPDEHLPAGRSRRVSRHRAR